MSLLPESFTDYIAADCDRAKFIQNYLYERGVQSVDINLEGKHHIYVKFPATHYNANFKIKTVIAHYDRFPESPGANDNSAADFCLMDWAVRLVKNCGAGDFHNVRLLFTDGEELGANGIAGQGAFALAAVFKRLGMTHDDVYVFDCVGRGCVPVIGKNSWGHSAPLTFQKQIADLEERSKNILRSSCSGRWLSLPLSYSDNAGFVAFGIPAVAITMLPEKEADDYVKALAKDKKLEMFVLRRKETGCFDGSREAELQRRKFESMLPETWQLFHTKYDSAESLTPESFALMGKILDSIAEEKTVTN